MFILGISISYLYVRYTKPVFQSDSIIKLNFESEANTLGLVSNTGLQQGLNDISGEIELIKSNIFLSRAVDELNYPVSYFIRGRYLVDERYKNSPFDVSFKIKNQNFLNKEFDVFITNPETFQLSYDQDSKKIISEYEFGEEISNDNFNFLIEKTDFFNEDLFGRYYFIVNSKESLVNYLKKNLIVIPENFNAKTIKIGITDYNKYKARDFVNIVDELYLLSSTEKKNQTISQKIDFLDEQIESTEDKIQGFDKYFENFTIENKTVSLQNDLSKTIGYLHALDSQRFNAQESISAVEIIRSRLNNDEELILNPFFIQKLPQFIREAINSYQELVELRKLKLNSYNENTSVIRRIDNQLGETRGNVLELVDQYLKNLKENLTDLNSRIASLESNFIQLPSMGTEYNKNRKLYQQLEEQMLLLRKSKMELEITKAGTVTDFQLLSPASIPSSPIKPQKFLIIGAGMVASIIMSLLFVAIRYLTHNKITSVRELEKLTSVPIIGSIPHYDKEKLLRTRLVIDNHSKSPISEALRSIRTNMEFMKAQEETHLITITSTVGSEGKTFVAVNLGAIIAFTGQKVCIVDLDMRKPKVHLAFNQEENPNGVSTILIGKSTVKESLQKTDLENMYYIGAGPTPPNPSELILTDAYDNMLMELKKSFDVVLLDTPPVGLVTDGVLAMKKSDLLLYIMKADYSNRVFLRTVRDLQRTNKFRNMAILLNGIKRGSGHYGYGYGYKTDGGYYSDLPEKNLISMIRSLFY